MLTKLLFPTLLLILCSNYILGRDRTVDSLNHEVRFLNNQIEELKRMAPWQKTKLLSQSRQFSVKQLLIFHARLADIDVKSKTGGLAMPLSETIDFLLLSI